LVTVRAIYTLYKRQLQFRQFMASSQGFSSGLYFRLMIISSADVLATIPLGTYVLFSNVKEGVGPWRSWASTHSHYSVIYQIPGSIWKNNRQISQNLDMFRWLLVGCAFIFFAFFGFAEEARQNYRRVYTSLACRIGYSKSTLRGSSHTCVAHLT
jgi:pheromone a factor receptor